MIWIIFIAMTAAVLAALLYPVLWSSEPQGAPDREAYDRAIFRDQLAELDRDAARGAIGGVEAEAARNEISRRLISAVGSGPKAPAKAGPPSLAVLAVLIVPLVALPLYLKSGRPSLPDVPLASRLDNATATGDFDALLAKVERHLAGQPDDVQGWLVLAPAYRKAQRWNDAADAFRNVLRLQPPDAGTLADFAEMLVFANQGMVPADAQRVFIEALKLDPQLAKARFFHALALKQEGKTTDAATAFEALLADTPPDAGYRPMLEAELKDMNSRPPALSQDTIAAAQDMSASDRQAMIQTMVDGLEQKLKANGDDLEGWLKLMRARSVLGDAARAAAAYKTAKDQFNGKPEALAALDGLAKELNIQ